MLQRHLKGHLPYFRDAPIEWPLHSLALTHVAFTKRALIRNQPTKLRNFYYNNNYNSNNNSNNNYNLWNCKIQDFVSIHFSRRLFFIFFSCLVRRRLFSKKLITIIFYLLYVPQLRWTDRCWCSCCCAWRDWTSLCFLAQSGLELSLSSLCLPYPNPSFLSPP